MSSMPVEQSSPHKNSPGVWLKRDSSPSRWERNGSAVPATPGTPANAPAARITDIVINEIMYDPPSDARTGEFVELYNRGSTTINLGGWSFVDGISFTFPTGTTLGPGSHLVVGSRRRVDHRAIRFHSGAREFFGTVARFG